MNIVRLDPYESKDDLGLSIVVLVVPSFFFLSLLHGKTIAEGGHFSSFPSDFSIFLVSLYLFNYICNFKSFSDVRNSSLV
jgi:hypothetical protein